MSSRDIQILIDLSLNADGYMLDKKTGNIEIKEKPKQWGFFHNRFLFVPIIVIFFVNLCAVFAYGYQSSSETIPKKSDNPCCLERGYRFSYDDLDKYKKWIHRTTDDSKRNKNYAIIIDKASYTLNLLKDGNIIEKYNIELGSNPYDDKKKEGDGCTPEGLYRLLLKKYIGQTRFYKAFLINYPNGFNWERFRELKESGVIPELAKIGGNIEIHGGGTGYKGNSIGKNWTAGCIGLSNKDMDALFTKVNKDCPITIVKYGTKQIY